MNKFFTILVFVLSVHHCWGQDLWEYAKVPYKFVSFKIPVDSKPDSLVFGDTHIYFWEYSEFSFSFNVNPWTHYDDTILTQKNDSLEVWKFENILSLLRTRSKIIFSEFKKIETVELYHIRYKTFIRKNFVLRKPSNITSIFLFMNGNFKCGFAISCKKSSRNFREFYAIEKRFIESLEFR